MRNAVDVDAVVEATVRRLAPLLSGEPLLWNVKTAMERTALPRDRIIHAFHAGEVDGMWSGGVRGKGSILLKPESVLEWIDRQVTEQAQAAPLGRGRETPALQRGR